MKNRRKLGLVTGMLVGSMCLYCGNSAVNGAMSRVNEGPGDGGSLLDSAMAMLDGAMDGAFSPKDQFVPDARAQSCTTCTQKFTKLAEGDLATGASSTPISVGAYASVVVYVTTNTCAYDPVNFWASFRPDAATAFGATGQTLSAETAAGGRLRVDGSDLQLAMNAGTAGTPCSIHYVVAGYSTM